MKEIVTLKVPPLEYDESEANDIPVYASVLPVERIRAVGVRTFDKKQSNQPDRVRSQVVPVHASAKFEDGLKEYDEYSVTQKYVPPGEVNMGE